MQMPTSAVCCRCQIFLFRFRKYDRYVVSVVSKVTIGMLWNKAMHTDVRLVMPIFFQFSRRQQQLDQLLTLFAWFFFLRRLCCDSVRRNNKRRDSL